MHKLCIDFSPEWTIYMWGLQSVKVNVFEVATSVYEIVPKKSSSSWEHWASTDLSMCCCLQSSFGVQAMNCASEKTWSLHLSYVLVMKSAWKKNSPGYSSRNSLPIFMAISIGSLSNFRLSGWLSCQQTGNPHQVLVHNSPLNYNYTSADTKILPLWLQASFGKRVSK